MAPRTQARGGFLVTFLFGGITGIMLAPPPLDFAALAHGAILMMSSAVAVRWLPGWTGCAPVRCADPATGRR